MAAKPQQERRLLCLTMLGYCKAGLTEEELCHFQVTRHAQLVSPLMEKYGILRYTITHNAKAPRALMSRLFDPRYVEYSDHDFVVRIIFPELSCFENLKNDPVYLERVKMDHLNFAEREDPTRRTKMTLGYVHEIIHEGKVVYAEDSEVAPCKVNNAIFEEGKGVFHQEKIDKVLQSGAVVNGVSYGVANGVH